MQWTYSASPSCDTSHQLLNFQFLEVVIEILKTNLNRLQRRQYFQDLLENIKNKLWQAILSKQQHKFSIMNFQSTEVFLETKQKETKKQR